MGNRVEKAILGKFDVPHETTRTQRSSLFMLPNETYAVGGGINSWIC